MELTTFLSGTTKSIDSSCDPFSKKKKKKQSSLGCLKAETAQIYPRQGSAHQRAPLTHPPWFSFIKNQNGTSTSQIEAADKKKSSRPSQDIVRLRKVAATCVSSRPKSAASELRDS